MKAKILLAASLLAMILLLLYTFLHTGELLASYARQLWSGYAAAAGIELAVATLAFYISDLRRGHKVGLGFYLFVLAAVVIVSAVANWVMGFQARHGVELTVQSIALLDPIQAFTGVISTALISLIVFALAEIIGSSIDAVLGRGSDEDKDAVIEQRDETIQELQITVRELQAANDVLNVLPAYTAAQFIKVLAQAAGEEIPAAAVLAESLGVTHQTVNKGYRLAEDNGR